MREVYDDNIKIMVNTKIMIVKVTNGLSNNE